MLGPFPLGNNAETLFAREAEGEPTMDGIYQSGDVHVWFEVNTLTNHGDCTPLVSVRVEYAFGRKVKVEKRSGYGITNQAQIDMAKRAIELGLEAAVPAPDVRTPDF